MIDGLVLDVALSRKYPDSESGQIKQLRTVIYGTNGVNDLAQVSQYQVADALFHVSDLEGINKKFDKKAKRINQTYVKYLS